MKKLFSIIFYLFFSVLFFVNQSTAQNVSKISIANGKSFIIKPNKTLWFSGIDIGLDTISNKLSFAQIDNNAYNGIASNGSTSFVLRNDSTIWGWGNNWNGQLGDSTTINRNVLTQITKSQFLSVQKSRSGVTMAIKSDSSVWAWGTEYYGQFADNKTNRFGNDTSISYKYPVQILTDKYLKISSNNHILAIKTDSTLWAWGYNGNGQVGDGTKTVKRAPVKISNYKFISIFAGDASSFAIKSDSTLWGWGYNGSGQLGVGDLNERLIPTQIGTRKYKYVTAGGGTVLAIDVNDELYIWGNSYTGLYKTVGNITNNTPTVLDSEKYKTVVTDGMTIIAEKLDGSFIGWGDNYNGQLGLNKNYTYNDLQVVKNSSDNNRFSFINQNGYGGSHLAQKTDGSLWVWGSNADGFLGVNDRIDRTLLTNIPLSYPLTRISKGVSHTLALGADNKLWAWGENNGNFGDNSYPNSFIPVQIGTDTYKYVGADIDYSVFIKQDGSLWSSGTTTWGSQLGTGLNQNPVYNKVKIDNTHTYLTAFPGILAVFAIQSDSSLWGWGSNWNGWLGDGTTVDKYVPTRISSTKFKKIVSYSQVLAIENNGNLWAWGENFVGQVGIGFTGQNVLSPIKISTDIWMDVAAASEMSYGIKSDSSLWAWGNRSGGLFGTGTVVNSNVPVKVSTLKFKSISASQNEIIAIKSDGTLISFGVNLRGSLGIGELDYYTTAQTIFSVPPPSLNYTSNKIVSSGSQIIIRGENLLPTYSITYNGINCTYLIVSDNLVKVNIPTASGSGNLVFKAPQGDATLTGIIYVSPQSNSAPVDIVLTNSIVEENNSLNRSIGHFIADDAESDVTKFELVIGSGSDDNASFYIDSNRLVAKTSFDYEVKSICTIRVKATDAAGLSFEKAFKINIIDVPESILINTNVKISAFNTSSGFVLKNDSSLWGWSTNSYGQLGDSTNVPKYGLVQITRDKYIDFSTDGYTVLAIKSDSTLWAWGYNNTYSVYGDGSVNTVYYPVKVSTDKFISVSISNNYNGLAIRSDGTLWTWGNNNYGQLGDGTLVAKTTRVKITNDKFIAAKGSGSSSFAIKADGTLWAWGDNYNGQLGDGTKINKTSPAIISNDKFKSLGINNHSSYITNYAMGADSTLWSWGANYFGELGLGLADTESVFSPRKISNERFIDFSVGSYYAMAIKSDSTLWGVGDNGANRMGDTVTTYTNTFRKLSNSKFARIFATNSYFSIVVPSNGIAFWYGSGNLNNIFKYRPTYLNDFTKISNAKNLIAENNKNVQKTDLSWWSSNNSYNGTSAESILTDKVKLKNYNFIKLEGTSSYIALNKSGELYTWGYNPNGQLGNGTNIINNTPTRVGVDYYIDFSSSGNSVLAIKTDGSLWAWGYNGTGQLGDSTSTTRILPVKIDAGPFVSIYINNNSSYAIKSDGTLYAWGYNGTGQLGNGSYTATKFPNKIGSNKYLKIVTGSNHVVALARDSTVWTWGYNYYGQVGDNTTNTRATPYQINIGTNAKFTDIGADGNGTSYAIKNDGSLYSWGYNGSGVLGDGSFTNYLLPKLASTAVFKSISQKNAGSVYFIMQDSSTYMVGVAANNFYTPTTSYFSMVTPLINMYPNFTPYSPSTIDTNFCSLLPTSAIVAKATNGSSLLYYTQATGGTPSISPYIPSSVKADTLNYYVSQINNKGYESARRKLTVIIKNSPVAPTVTDTVYCNNILADSLKAIAITGDTLLWYGNNAVGGTKSYKRTVPDTKIVGSAAYYVSQLSPLNGCESPRAKISVKINPLPANPIAMNNYFCLGDTGKIATVNNLTGHKLYWYGTYATAGTGSLTTTKVLATTVGSYNYYVTQKNDTTFCESGRTIVPINISNPLSAPIISRDNNGNLSSTYTYGNTWYMDGSKITDTTNTFKPTAVGKYTVKNSFLGCISPISSEYYYLITDIINISADEFINLAPNPFVNYLNVNFALKKYQKLNFEVFDIANGSRVFSGHDLITGSKLQLSHLSPGIYIIKVTTNDNKFSYQFKMVKL